MLSTLPECQPPKREERREDGPPDGGHCVVAKVDRVQLKELGKRGLWDVHDLVVGNVQDLDALLGQHRDLKYDTNMFIMG